MAESDYNVADRQNADGSNVKTNPVTAGDRVNETVQATPDQDARDFAAAAGVSQAAYANYAAALTTHEGRDDIESLADRRARTYGTTFAAGNFMRADAYNANGTAAAPPRPGTIEGDAPQSTA